MKLIFSSEEKKVETEQQQQQEEQPLERKELPPIVLKIRKDLTQPEPVKPRK